MDDGKKAILVLNMGAPADAGQVEPFLYELFSDSDMIQLPMGWAYQKLLARKISSRRAPLVAPHYDEIGGSPLLEQTNRQAAALHDRLQLPVFVCMRYTAPRAESVIAEVKKADISEIIALPLYPQYSRTTTFSSFKELDHFAAKHGISVTKIDGYCDDESFIDALVARYREIDLANIKQPFNIFCTSHSIPEKYVRKGDPYIGEVERTFAALQKRLSNPSNMSLVFQSRIGRVKWHGPFLTDELEKAGKNGVKTVIVWPVSFVSEHLETLYELDIEIAEIAHKHGITDFLRVRTVQDHPVFIDCLQNLVVRAMEKGS